MFHDKTMNSQAKKTRLWLRDALLSLMKEGSFDRIKINEITTRADVSRLTFYNHFNSKEEILTEYIETILEEYFFEMKTGDSDHSDSMYQLVLVFERYEWFFNLLIRDSLTDLLKDRFAENYDRIYKSISGVQIDTSKDGYIYYARFFASSLTEIIVQWLSNGRQEPAQDIANLIIRFRRNPYLYE